MNISLSPFAPENLVSRDGFGSPAPRQPAHLHTQAESNAYLRDSSRLCMSKLFSNGSSVPPRVSLLISILRLNLMLTYGIPPDCVCQNYSRMAAAPRGRAIPYKRTLVLCRIVSSRFKGAVRTNPPRLFCNFEFCIFRFRVGSSPEGFSRWKGGILVIYVVGTCVVFVLPGIFYFQVIRVSPSVDVVTGHIKATNRNAVLTFF